MINGVTVVENLIPGLCPWGVIEHANINASDLIQNQTVLMSTYDIRESSAEHQVSPLLTTLPDQLKGGAGVHRSYTNTRSWQLAFLN